MMIAAALQETFEPVSVLLLRAGGARRIETPLLDLSPAANGLVKMLGGETTIVGQMPLLDAVILKRRNPSADAPRNEHELPFPFHVDEDTQQAHVGDLVLVRMNAEAKPESLSLGEFNEFMQHAPRTKESHEVWWKKHSLGVAKEGEEEEGDFGDEDEDEEDENGEAEGGEEEDDEDDDDEEELDDRTKAVAGMVLERFIKEKGRPPTEEEFPALVAEELAAREAGGGEDEDEDEEEEEEDDDDDDDDGDDNLQAAVTAVVHEFSAQYGRAPTAQEVRAILSQSGVDDDDKEKDDDDDDEGEDDEEEDEDESAAKRQRLR